MGELLQPTHLLLILVIALVVFGPRRLPELGKGLGEGLRGFKEGLKGNDSSTPTAATQQNTAPSPPTSTPIEPK